jgi:tRNA pseudouridine55 synthase
LAQLGIDGALIIDKPAGPTSHDVVAVARRSLETRQVGHTGTLDPLATGVLVLLVGRATRLSQFIVHDEKEYVAGVRLGLATPTYDAEGVNGEGQIAVAEWRMPSAELLERLEAVLDSFRGTFEQTPPPFSAKKIRGRRAYEHARAEREVDMTPVQVTVRELERLPSTEPSLVRLRLVVGAGFYVRSLAHDIGQRLGSGAHLESLRRTRSGPFTITDSIRLDALAAGAPRLLPLNRLVADMPAVRLSDEGFRLAAHGNAVGMRHLAEAASTAVSEGRVRLLAPDGELVAIGRHGTDALLHPQVVLV